MSKPRLYGPSIGALLAVWLSSGIAVAGDPVDSNSALAGSGGGCFAPPIVQTSPFDQLPAVNPEWAPVVNGSVPFSAPILVHGTAVDSHISREDFPAGHVRFDQNTDIHCSSSSGRPAATRHGRGPVKATGLSPSAAGSSIAATPTRYPATSWERAFLA